jgi:hypothetical protein
MRNREAHNRFVDEFFEINLVIGTIIISVSNSTEGFMSQPRDTIFQSIFQCCSREELESSLQD